mmetsp:Transcript_24243/g.49622  ORF Transcript_24243/g.49622 Transcript_24243/m.49622 type:complete len:246 (+) Transcript_24243:260-997(+)
MTMQGNEEWAEFSSAPIGTQFEAQIRLETGSNGILRRPNGERGASHSTNERFQFTNAAAPGSNTLPGIFGAYQQRFGSGGDFAQSARVRSTTTRDGLVVPALSHNLTFERKKQTEIDTKTLDAEGLKTLKEEDPFLYHSIPAVSSSTRFWDDVDLKEVQHPSRETMKRSMDSCPAKMLTFTSSRSSGIERCNMTTVKRRTRISHEVHTSLLAIDDHQFESDDESDDDDNDDIVETLLRVMSKATV